MKKLLFFLSFSIILGISSWATDYYVATNGNNSNSGTYSSPFASLEYAVSGTITPSNTSATKIDVKDVRDVSIIGAGSGAEFNGIGIKVYKAGNVILRNLKVHHVDIGDKDCISIEGPADHIWVDHCELYNVYQGADKDYYDGLLDAKKNSEYITYSWNYLHDSWKTMLVGNSESDDYDRKITAHHNIFENCNSRMPLYRYGTGHFYNNYYVDDSYSTAINSRLRACLRIENNYFENVQNPYVTAYSDEDGYGELIGNVLDNCTFSYSDEVRELQSCGLSVPYSYESTLNDASSVPDITRQYAGVGKLENPESYTFKAVIGTSTIASYASPIKLEAYPNPFSGSTTINFELKAEREITFKLLDMTGRIVDVVEPNIYPTGQNHLIYENSELKPGLYILSVQYGSNVENIRIVAR